MAGQPDLLDVTLEGHPASRRIADPALGKPCLRALPRLIRVPLAAERPGRALAALQVRVVGRVARLAVAARPLAAVTHDNDLQDRLTVI